MARLYTFGRCYPPRELERDEEPRLQWAKAWVFRFGGTKCNPARPMEEGGDSYDPSPSAESTKTLCILNGLGSKVGFKKWSLAPQGAGELGSFLKGVKRFEAQGST